MQTDNDKQIGPGNAAAGKGGNHKAAPKQAAVVGDGLFPMPRSALSARTVLEQAGLGADYVLVRDHGGPDDVTFPDEGLVDLRQGNVFNAVLKCDHVPNDSCNAPAKLAYVINDSWEVTLIGTQTRESLIRLFGLPADTEIIRDYESPNDEVIKEGAAVLFPDGAVLLARKLSIAVTINNRPEPVRFTKRRVTGLEIKQTAIAQGVPIEIGFVLYHVQQDGSLSPSIGDEQVVILKDCDSFRCVAQDDVS